MNALPKLILLISACTLATVPRIWAAPPETANASVSGTVVAEGMPVPQAIVIATGAGAPAFRQATLTAPDGTFTITGLPAGAYSLCVQVPAGGYLDPCEWGGVPVPVSLAAGQRLPGTVLSIAAGAVLKVRVQDETQLLYKKLASGFTPDLTMGIFGPNGLFYPVHLVRRDVHGADFQITLPPNTALAFSVWSKALKITDVAGTALPVAGLQQPLFTGSALAGPQPLVYTIGGNIP